MSKVISVGVATSGALDSDEAGPALDETDGAGAALYVSCRSVGAACKLESKASFGCTCPTQNHADCDCTGTAYQAVVEIWPIAMTVLGAAGAH